MFLCSCASASMEGAAGRIGVLCRQCSLTITDTTSGLASVLSSLVGIHVKWTCEGVVNSLTATGHVKTSWVLSTNVRWDKVAGKCNVVSFPVCPQYN